MKKILLILFIAFVYVIPFNKAHAHVLEVDGNIGSVLHLDPDDDPVIGQQATLYFDIKDKTNKFNLQQCNCFVTISLDNTIIHTQEFTHVTAKNPTFTYSFSEKGVYTIVLKGAPQQPSLFDPFTLTYVFRVTREKDSTSTSSNSFFSQVHAVHYIGIGIVVIVFLGMIIKQSLDRKQT